VKGSADSNDQEACLASRISYLQLVSCGSEEDILDKKGGGIREDRTDKRVQTNAEEKGCRGYILYVYWEGPIQRQTSVYNTLW